VIPVYDKTNRYISLGSDLRVRKHGLELLLGELKKNENKRRQGISILDLGSGPGKMTELLLNIDSNLRSTVMLDALAPMMKVAKARNKDSEGVLGVYEHIPLRDGSFDCAIAGFAIRDARNLFVALKEISRILVNGGLFLIVDLSKPESRLKRALISVYWKAIAPLIAFLAAGRPGLKFGALYTTVRRLPTNRELIELLQSAGFSTVYQEIEMLGGVCTLLVTKR